MDPIFTVKEEYYTGGGSSTSSSSSRSSWQKLSDDDHQAVPRPMEGLNEMGPPPFLTKTYEMVDDLSTDNIVSWNRGGQSFVVWDPHGFSNTVLPRYFKHNNFSSFGFRKIDPEKWEFANESFLRGQKQFLKNIRRRKTSSSSSQPSIPSSQQQSIGPCIEVGRFGLDAEIDSLRRDKHVLWMEIVKLRQQQQSTKAYLQQMELRLQGTEKKQQQMMSFLAKAMQNPDFIHQLVQQKDKRKELEEAISKKRRRPIEAGESSRVKSEPLDLGYPNYGFHQVSELEALALEMQGFGRVEIVEQRMGNYEKDLDEGFWEELLNEGFDGDEEDVKEDVNVLAERLGFLGSSPK